MQLNKLNNIVFLKELESNVIEEAFVVLKDNVNLTNFEKRTSKTSGKKAVLNEVEILINSELKVNELKFEEYKVRKLIRKNRILKFINFVLVVITICLFLNNK